MIYFGKELQKVLIFLLLHSTARPACVCIRCIFALSLAARVLQPHGSCERLGRRMGESPERKSVQRSHVELGAGST